MKNLLFFVGILLLTGCISEPSKEQKEKQKEEISKLKSRTGCAIEKIKVKDHAGVTHEILVVVYRTPSLIELCTYEDN